LADPGSANPALAVVVGASGGLGRALAERLIESGGYQRVIALSRRQPECWKDDARRAWAPVDLLDEDSIAAAASYVATIGVPTRIIIATGRLSGVGLTPEKSMRALDTAALTEIFAVNAIGPALVAKHLLPLTPRDRTSLFAALSARVGSIGDNRLGGWYGYRASKAALNMFIHSLAIEHRRTRPLGVCVALHPGTVKTALSAPFQAGAPEEKLFSPERSATALMQVMDGLGPDDTGAFFAWDGAKIPW
jgi:NAD(P)-dependent dehydrogenase (short-subunit alcohol dehydrogenase family)